MKESKEKLAEKRASETQAALGNVVRQRDELQMKLTSTAAELRDAKASIESLKSELATALSNLSRFQGYVDRVLEGDFIREGKTQVTPVPAEPRIEIVRHGPQAALTIFEAAPVAYDYGSSTSTKSPKPWFSR